MGFAKYFFLTDFAQYAQDFKVSQVKILVTNNFIIDYTKCISRPKIQNEFKTDKCETRKIKPKEQQ